jgi:two-component system, NtrC family, sensor histidine kinase PilS
MRETLQWLMLARLALLYVVLTSVVLQQVFHSPVGPEFPLALAYGLLALGFLFNLFFAFFIPLLPQRWAIAAIHVLFDSILTSCWIYYSKDGESLFALLYLVQILTVSLILYQKGAWLASAVASLCFGWVTFFSREGSAITWLTFSAIFLSVGMVGGYLSEELLRTSQSLKEKQRKIEKLMALHERIIANLPTGLLTVDGEMRINFINPAGEHILGKVSKNIVGKSLTEIEPGLLPFFTNIETQALAAEEAAGTDPALRIETTLADHRTFFMHSDKGQARLQQRVEVGRGRQVRILRGDVAEFELEAGLGNLLTSKATNGRVLLFQDVTLLLQLEEKLKQNEKLAAVGQLAAGIAHEIRNPLASMSASIEMLKDSMPMDGAFVENQKLMDIAIREIDRLNGLISEFLDFVKPEKLRFEPVSLDQVLSELTMTLGKLNDVKKKFELRQSLTSDVKALANAEKLKQVIWNLLVNAVQSMNKEGTIEVGCARVGDRQVKFWVEDQGIGMNEEVLAHLYEPFFTTKEKGTGLGLATAYKIIEAHHGEIRVSSKPSVGTRFEVYLQAA